MTYALVLLVIVHVTLSKISILFGAPFLTESGCKGKEFQAYLPNIWGSFFCSSPGDFNALLRKGRTPGKTPTGTRTPNTDASFSKAGAKVRSFKHILQIFFRSFFGVFFKAQSQENMEGRQGSYQPELPNKMSYIEASVPESGCKTRHSNPTTQTLAQLFCKKK